MRSTAGYETNTKSNLIVHVEQTYELSFLSNSFYRILHQCWPKKKKKNKKTTDGERKPIGVMPSNCMVMVGVTDTETKTRQGNPFFSRH